MMKPCAHTSLQTFAEIMYDEPCAHTSLQTSAASVNQYVTLAWFTEMGLLVTSKTVVSFL